MKSNRSCTVGIAIGITILCLASVALAEDPYDVAWIAQIGTSMDDFSRCVAVDAAGNAYISGYTTGEVGGTYAGDWDAFVTKVDASGNELWSKNVGTATTDQSYSVATDAAGNAYISGFTYGDLGGSNAGDWDAFLTKVDASGNTLWSRQIGVWGNDQSHSVTTDASGNVYISGHTYDDLAGPSAGAYDAFLTKFDTSGNELWRRQIGTGSGDYSRSVAVDAVGNAYITGYTHGDLGGTNAGHLDAFLTMVDSSGNELWSRQIGTEYSDQRYSVAVDTAGNVYISGYTAGDLAEPSAGYEDAFLTKFDASGNELWRRQIGTASGDYSYCVVVDAVGNAYITGYTWGDIDGQNAGGADAFLIKFDPLGYELWRQQIGTTSNDSCWSVAMDGSGNVYMSGWTAGDLGGENAGYTDAFLVKFENPIPEPAAMSLLALGGVALLKRRRRA